MGKYADAFKTAMKNQLRSPILTVLAEASEELCSASGGVIQQLSLADVFNGDRRSVLRLEFSKTLPWEFASVTWPVTDVFPFLTRSYYGTSRDLQHVAIRSREEFEAWLVQEIAKGYMAKDAAVLNPTEADPEPTISKKRDIGLQLMTISDKGKASWEVITSYDKWSSYRLHSLEPGWEDTYFQIEDSNLPPTFASKGKCLPTTRFTDQRLVDVVTELGWYQKPVKAFFGTVGWPTEFSTPNPCFPSFWLKHERIGLFALEIRNEFHWYRMRNHYKDCLGGLIPIGVIGDEFIFGKPDERPTGLMKELPNFALDDYIARACCGH